MGNIRKNLLKYTLELLIVAFGVFLGLFDLLTSDILGSEKSLLETSIKSSSN